MEAGSASGAESELLADYLAEGVGDLSMPRKRGLSAVRRIAVQVMPAAVANQHAPRLFEFFDEGLALHTSNSTGCCRAAAGAGERS